jgi:hypothetical protein
VLLFFSFCWTSYVKAAAAATLEIFFPCAFCSAIYSLWLFEK